MGKPDFMDLPRKYKTAYLQPGVYRARDQRHSVICVNHPAHGPDLDLWVGGDLSTNPILIQRAGSWVTRSKIPEVWSEITSLFRDSGYRRIKTQLKFLIKDWGIEKI
ncbi:hypothetical protein [Mycobacterium lepromatosis]|nr:hypothetical protein [Mycobacterium lepromatosis]